MVDPFLVSVAAELATKTAGSLYELVAKAFRRHPDATRELAAAQGEQPDSPPVRALAIRLAQVGATDPEFARALRDLAQGGVVNQISGDVDGNVVQARDIIGDISF